MGFGVGVGVGAGFVGCGLDCFFLVKTITSAMMIASRITVTTTTAMMSRRLFDLHEGEVYEKTFSIKNAYSLKISRFIPDYPRRSGTSTSSCFHKSGMSGTVGK